MLSDFIQHLVNKKIIKQEDVNELSLISEKKGEKIEDLLLQKKNISEEEFFKEKSVFYNIPLKSIDVADLSSSILEEIPEETARRYKIIPFEKSENIFKVGLVNPEDISVKFALDFIARQKNVSIEAYLISYTEFNEYIKKYKVFKKEIETAVERLEEEEKKEAVKTQPEEILEKATGEAPISKIVSVIIKHAIEGKASDIHIEPFEDKTRVRFRVDGVLYPSLFLEKRFLPPVVSRIKILSNLRIDEIRAPQDGRFSTVLGKKKINFRVATFPTPEGEKVAIRVLDPSAAIAGFDQLGMKGRNVDIIKKCINLPFGMIIFCGPTGSGKTTSQYTILQDLNKEDVNIVTLEDPVEYWVKGINQSQVRPDIGYTFASGLRQILRQDPDIIMIGEIRDEETASLAVHAALTGHLVLSTLHTNTAAGALPRFIDMGVEPFLLPVALKLVVSQRLIRKLCFSCKEKVKANKEEEQIIEKTLSEISDKEKKRRKIQTSPPFYFYRSKGCRKCAEKGTKGRIGIYESLAMTKELEKIVINGCSKTEVSNEAMRQGMVTLKQDGVMKALEGTVSLEEVFKATEAKEEIF